MINGTFLCCYNEVYIGTLVMESRQLAIFIIVYEWDINPSKSFHSVVMIKQDFLG